MNNKWILTSEREPEKAGNYIITTKYGEVGYMNYYNGYSEDKRVYRKEYDFCSKGKREE